MFDSADKSFKVGFIVSVAGAMVLLSLLFLTMFINHVQVAKERRNERMKGIIVFCEEQFGGSPAASTCINTLK